MISENRVSIIGAGGHVGLPLSLVISSSGFDVTGIDIDSERVSQLMEGHVPFVEYGAEELLEQGLQGDRLRFTTEFDSISKAKTIILIIGTPIDSEHNPDLSALLGVFEKNKDKFRKGQLIVLRSTVSPNTTRFVKSHIESLTGLIEGEDFHLVFAPERAMQTKGIQETTNIPQLIGSFSDTGFKKAKKFFETFTKKGCIQLTPEEAEIGKLITNMARYISFAMANEFYIICDNFEANAHKIIKSVNYEYPRLDIPMPGANVGGPCLYKDGFFLLDDIAFPELIRTAFTINESIPSYLFSKAVKACPDFKKAAILGMTFKANCDDIRHSVSYRLKKRLKQSCIEIVEIDPYVADWEDLSGLSDIDVLFLMTPHKEFGDFSRIRSAINNPNCLVIDMWNFWKENTDISPDGVYLLSQTTK